MKKSLQLQSLQQDLPLSHLQDMMHKPQNKITMDIILMTLNHTAIRIQLMHKVIIITLGQEIESKSINAKQHILLQ